VLTAVFFGTVNLTGWTANSATAPKTVDQNGNTVCSSSCNVNVGWEFLSGISQYGAKNGIGAAGFNIFGQSNFGGTSTNIDGIDYGIVSSSFPTPTTNVNNGPLEKNSVTFDFTVPATFSLTTSIDPSSITFQFGTALSDASTGGTVTTTAVTPEVGTFFLAGLSLLTVGVFRRRLSALRKS
jgi:hypothetical protein